MITIKYWKNGDEKAHTITGRLFGELLDIAKSNGALKIRDQYGDYLYLVWGEFIYFLK